MRPCSGARCRLQSGQTLCCPSVSPWPPAPPRSADGVCDLYRRHVRVWQGGARGGGQAARDSPSVPPAGRWPPPGGSVPFSPVARGVTENGALRSRTVRLTEASRPLGAGKGWRQRSHLLWARGCAGRRGRRPRPCGWATPPRGVWPGEDLWPSARSPCWPSER